MASLQVLLDEYAESHQNPKNKLVHYVCVPTIAVTTLVIFWEIHFALFLIAVLGAGLYYFLLSPTIVWGLVPFLVACSILLASHPASLSISISLFLVAWALQFWGHKVEGKKPSFMKDLQFLLVGPLWVAAHVYDILEFPKS